MNYQIVEKNNKFTIQKCVERKKYSFFGREKTFYVYEDLITLDTEEQAAWLIGYFNGAKIIAPLSPAALKISKFFEQPLEDIRYAFRGVIYFKGCNFGFRYKEGRRHEFDEFGFDDYNLNSILTEFDKLVLGQLFRPISIKIQERSHQENTKRQEEDREAKLKKFLES